MFGQEVDSDIRRIIVVIELGDGRPTSSQSLGLWHSGHHHDARAMAQDDEDTCTITGLAFPSIQAPVRLERARPLVDDGIYRELTR